MQINDIGSVVRRILTEELDNASFSSTVATNDDGHRGIFISVDDAIVAAKAAREVHHGKPITIRQQVIDAIKGGFRPYIEETAKDIKEGTGMRTVETKIAKLHNALYNTPGPEILGPVIENDDGGIVTYERLPYDVIGAVGPSTNPSETVTANAIMTLVGGNTLYFGTYPGVKNITRWTIKKMNDFIADTTGLHNSVVSIRTPTTGSVQQVMQHPDIAMLAAVGRPAVVHQAMTNGKKAVGVGPGDPPAMVNATADVDLAAHNIIASASFDNDILRTTEKEVIAEGNTKDELIRRVQDGDAFVVNRKQADKLADMCIQDNGTPDRKFVGRDAVYILDQTNILYTDHPVEIICGLPKKHPLVVTEMLIPILPVISCPTSDDILKTTVEVEQGNHYTTTIHFNNLEHINNAVHRIRCSIFVVNGSSYAGAGVADDGAHSGASALTIATPTGEGTCAARTFTRRVRLSSPQGLPVRSWY